MTALRFFLIIVIFCMASLAWMILGTTIDYRTATLDKSLAEEVNNRWGPSSLVQPAPHVLPDGDERGRGGEPIDPASSTITVNFDHEHRSMGLLWFSTYAVQFSGEYAFQAPADVKAAAPVFLLRLPERVRSFENLTVTLDGQPYTASESDGAASVIRVRLPADNVKHTVGVTYGTRGRDRWEYASALEDAGRIPLIRDFAMTAAMNFTDIDYPKGSISPVKKAEKVAGGMKAAWQHNNLRATQRMGIEMPTLPNAGPVAGRMSYFAPVSLFFFFTVLFTIMLLRKVPLHPMHYLFISAGFFAFHILLAYLVDHVDLKAAFWISAATSVLLVVTYMGLVAGARFAVAYVGAAQLVYLIGFSYAFLWKGYTGLTVVIGAIATLFVLMLATGRVNWNEVFAAKAPARPPVAPAPIPPPAGAAR